MIAVEKSKLSDKIEEIIAELKRSGNWKTTEPAWVKNYEADTRPARGEFAEWMQFVYLPNCMMYKGAAAPSIVPQAIKYFGSDMNKGQMLLLLIELDALI